MRQKSPWKRRFRPPSSRARRRLARASKVALRVLGLAAFGLLLVVGLTFTAQAPAWMWEPYAKTLGRLEALVKVATPLVILVGLYIAWRRSSAHELQARTAEQGQITERFTKAVEQLADERLAVRLGGIYALERIAADSHDRDHRVVFEVLCAFVREKRTPKKGTRKGKDLGELPQDVLAVLSVIRRRERIPEGEIIRLKGADLRGANLYEAHLELAYLREAWLEGAYLREAHLEQALLVEAHLERADLTRAHLEGANLRKAHLEGTDLFEAHIEGADLDEANLAGADLILAHLEGADLRGAHLEGAWLEEAYLTKADLEGGHLEGADLRGAKGLTAPQLAYAHGDAKTRLPDDCPRPEHWPPFFPEPEPSDTES